MNQHVWTAASKKVPGQAYVWILPQDASSLRKTAVQLLVDYLLSVYLRI